MITYPRFYVITNSLCGPSQPSGAWRARRVALTSRSGARAMPVPGRCSRFDVPERSDACGTGKSWIACAFAHKACLEGFQAQYRRLPRLLTELRIAHGEGTIPNLYQDLARIDLLVVDDWGIAPIDAARRRDLLEILDDRRLRRRRRIERRFQRTLIHLPRLGPTQAANSA